MGVFYLPMQACVLSFRNRRFLSPPSYSLPIYRFPYHIIGNPRRYDFPMQRYSGRPVVKYRCANRLMDLHGSLPKSKISFQSPCRRSLSGWVFREIPDGLLAFPSFPRCLTCM